MSGVMMASNYAWKFKHEKKNTTIASEYCVQVYVIH